MKKLLIALLLLLTSCSLKSDADKPYFLFVAPLENHPIWLKTKDGFLTACQDFNINCDWKGPEVIAPETMRNIMYEGILKEADGIITQGVVPMDVMLLAKDANIPVVMVDSDVKGAPRLSLLVKDFEKQAALLLDDIFSHFPDQDLKIAIQVAELDFGIAQDQISAFEDLLESKEGNHEIVAISESKSDSLTSRNEWTKLLRKHENIDVLVSFAAEAAIEAVYVVNQIEYENPLLIFAVDEMTETLELIDKGEIHGTIITSFYDYGYKAVESLVEHLEDPNKTESNVAPVKLQLKSRDNHE